jgi:hypothetical protein
VPMLFNTPACEGCGGQHVLVSMRRPQSEALTEVLYRLAG